MISVITITYNNFDELKQTLVSLQSLDNIEIIVVDGGSCQKSKELIKARTDRYHIGPDKGIADAFNKGLSLVSADKVIFLNSGDVLIDKNYFLEAEKYLKNNQACPGVHSSILYIDELAGPILMGPKKRNLGRGMPYFHQTMILRTEVIKMVGQFNLDFKIAMDFDFVVRLHKLGFYLHYLDFKKAVVRMDGAGISAKREWLSINECKLSLLRNDVYIKDFNFLGFYQRICLKSLRSALEIMGLKNILQKAKRLKYNKKTYKNK